MSTVYVSHPIKGQTADQVSAAELRGIAWAEHHGYAPLLPRNIGAWEHPGAPCPEGSNGNGGQAGEAEHDHGCYMRGDLVAMLTEADAILMMPGWERSNGARAEMQTALVVNMPVFFYQSASS